MTKHIDCVELAVMRAFCQWASTDYSKRVLSELDDKSKSDDSLLSLLKDFSFSRTVEQSSVDIISKDYFVSNFLRKWKGFDLAVNLEDVTFATWESSEKQCFRTNRRLVSEAQNGFYTIPPHVISDAQRKIAQILGYLDVDNILQLCRFGKGATSSIARKDSSIASKMLLEPSITFDCIPYFCKSIAGDSIFQESVGGFDRLDIVDANRMVMVPKSASTHRMIAAEPTMNSFIQQGVGRHIRKRLKAFGVDLDDQTINQDLAFRALADGFSTIDLSSASDTLCNALVKLLLPHEWYSFLDDIRCKKSTFRGKKYLLSKFSSMGNAFTFELESLIFFALSWAASKDKHSVSVYGDDIICSKDDFAQVVSTLTWAGFSLNADKSYTFPSRFYESCGRHYYDLEDITPPYQKDVCIRAHDFIRLHNRIVRSFVRLRLPLEVCNKLCCIIIDYADRTLSAPKGVKTFSKLSGPLTADDRYFISLASISDTEKYWRGRDRIRVLCLDNVQTLESEDESRERVLYAYKLRRPETLNSSPEGYCQAIIRNRYAYSYAYIWRSASLT